MAFYVKSQITDNRPSKQDDSIADERLVLVEQKGETGFETTSPARLIDLHPPAVFAKPIEPPVVTNDEEIIQWSFNNITLPQFHDTKRQVEYDAVRRKEYLESAFTQVIIELSAEIQELQSKSLIGDAKVQEKILVKHERIQELLEKKQIRLQQLTLAIQVAPKAPEILGCAYVVPLSHVEYKNHYGMSRDDEAEAIAMRVAMEYECRNGWVPENVSMGNEGYDIRSTSLEQLKRYIEVKGRSGSDGSVMLTENEMNRLAQLGDTAWLYIVIHCKSEPELYRIQNPAGILNFELKSKGIQYYLPMASWTNKVMTGDQLK